MKKVLSTVLIVAMLLSTATIGALANKSLPEAIFERLAPVKLTAADNYTVLSGGDNTVDRPLNVVVKFAAIDTEETVQSSPYKDYITDFNLTFDGLTGDSFVADDCYLAGNYGGYGWWVIPVDGVDVPKGQKIPVMGYYGINLPYSEICTGVKEMTCAIYIDEAVIEANPDMTVTLDLIIRNPENNQETIINSTTYDADALLGNVAKIGTTGYKSIEEALKAVKAGETVTILEGTYTMATSFSLPANVSIVGEGEVLLEGTLTGTLEDLTLKNLYIKGGNAQRWAYAKGDLVFENVTFEATSVYALHFDDISLDANLLYKDCTIIGWAAMGGSPASCVFDGCTIKDNGTYGVIRTYFDAEIKGCTFDVDGANTEDVYQDGIHAVGATVNVNNCTNVNGDIKDILNISKESYIYVDEVLVLAPVKTHNVSTKAELVAAIAEAQDGDTITLVSDITVDDQIIKNTKKITLELNGKTITGTDNNTSGNFYLINNVGTLTIKDSIGGGKITLTATNDRDWNASSVVLANNPGGKLIVESGTIEHLGGTDMAYGIDNLTNGKGTYAETIINGGTIKSTYRAIRQFLNGVEAQNILTVNGGTIEGANKSIWMQDPSKNANTGTLTVNEGATLNGDVYLFVTAGSTEWPVEVSIDADALAEGSTVVTGNIPVGYVVEETNGTWGVEREYTITLSTDGGKNSDGTAAIAFNAFFKQWEDQTVDAFGMYIYKQSDKLGRKVTVDGTTAGTELVAAEGLFNAVVTAIPAEAKEDLIVCLPYVIVDGNTIAGEVKAVTASQFSKILAD